MQDARDMDQVGLTGASGIPSNTDTLCPARVSAIAQHRPQTEPPAMTNSMGRTSELGACADMSTLQYSLISMQRARTMMSDDSLSLQRTRSVLLCGADVRGLRVVADERRNDGRRWEESGEVGVWPPT